MSDSGDPAAGPTGASVEDRRRAASSGPHAQRRFNDNLVNRVRWPAFVIVWFVLGAGLLLYLIYRFLR